MKSATIQPNPHSIRDLLDRRNQLILEIDRYLQSHRDLSRLSRQGLRRLGFILHEPMREFEPAKKV